MLSISMACFGTQNKGQYLHTLLLERTDTNLQYKYVPQQDTALLIFLPTHVVVQKNGNFMNTLECYYSYFAIKCLTFM
jgi:hypothetical protein